MPGASSLRRDVNTGVMAQAVAPNATGIGRGVVNSQPTPTLLTTRTRSVAVIRRQPAPIQLQFNPLAASNWPRSDLRLAESRLSVELLELLDMHPAVSGAYRADQCKNLDVSKNGCCIAEHEPAPEVIYERHAPSALGKNHRPPIRDHLQLERRWLGQRLERRRQLRRVEIRLNVDVESDQAPAF